MYCDAFGLAVLARFQDHDGFDGVMLGREGTDYHFEFTHCRTRPVAPTPTPEDLIVFHLPDGETWKAACDRATYTTCRRNGCPPASAGWSKSSMGCRCMPIRCIRRCDRRSASAVHARMSASPIR
ncbi:hypothetical protein [Burkholderia ubonensis]|uniref:hypothetical protein n=1 Tax=Burkholderia ubonensis TaxID=101571 RepID=UPI002FC5F3A1